MGLDTVQYGDMVIVYYGFNDMQAVRTEKGKVMRTRYGDLSHEDLVGRGYGNKVQLRSGYVQLLRFTPELWNSTLDHRTQIMYLPDISVIIAQLDLRPGSIVCEAGTGSGAMTHHIANCILPHGSVYTFDFHANRVERAKSDFEAHGLGGIVHAAHRDVCSNGFGEALHGRADAVLLDLPGAHRVVQHAAAALRPGGRLCTFQPCIEQVHKVHTELTEGPYEFADLMTCECLLRPWIVKRCDVESFEFDSDGTARSCQEAESATKPNTIAAGTTTDNSASRQFSKFIPTYLRTEKKNQTIAVPAFEARGHTAYLTFATFIRKRESANSELLDAQRKLPVDETKSSIELGSSEHLVFNDR